jgi:hypothetical protein
MGDVRPGFDVKAKNGSRMAPQSVEMAQNGLDDPPACDTGKEN